MSQRYNEKFSRREHCWGYISIYENTPKKLPHLPPKSICKLEHSSHTVKVVVEATC